MHYRHSGPQTKSCGIVWRSVYVWLSIGLKKQKLRATQGYIRALDNGGGASGVAAVLAGLCPELKGKK